MRSEQAKVVGPQWWNFLLSPELQLKPLLCPPGFLCGCLPPLCQLPLGHSLCPLHPLFILRVIRLRLIGELDQILPAGKSETRSVPSRAALPSLCRRMPCRYLVPLVPHCCWCCSGGLQSPRRSGTGSHYCDV